MIKIVNFPQNIFSEKELTDFKRRQEVVRLLGVGETWKNIRSKTGAHLQTIAILAKRLKSQKVDSQFKPSQNQKLSSPIFEFGSSSEKE